MKTLNYSKAKHFVIVEFPASPTTVFNHLSDLSKWWPEDFVGENIKLNSEFIFKIGDEHFSRNKIIEFVPEKKLVWLTTESKRKSDGFDWSGTKFIFELASKGSNTELKFTYDGVILENESERLAMVCDMCVKDRLYNLIVNGKGK